MNAMQAEVISVKPEKIVISVKSISDLDMTGESLKVGAFLEIENDDDSSTLAVLKSFSIGSIHEDNEDKQDPQRITIDKSKSYILEASPLGVFSEGEFKRGSDTLPIPPKGVRIADKEKIKKIYSVDDNKSFCFSDLLQNNEINVSVDGNSFFGKHFSILGSTGSGKSHTTAKILQNVIAAGDANKNINNSHIIVFDIHSEYKTAFPSGNKIDASELALPYWLLNSEELEELFLDSGDNNNYNQQSLLRSIITENKRNESKENKIDIFYDSPVKFDIKKILNCLDNLRRETVSSSDSMYSQIEGNPKQFESLAEKIIHLSSDTFDFSAPRNKSKEVEYGIKSGPFADGSIDKFYTRLHSKVIDRRLDFIFGSKSVNASFENIVKEITGYNKKNNITIIDLSGVPFEVLSTIVSLISRLLFDFGYFRKKYLNATDTPLLVVYEEAHKYVPRSELTKYKSVKSSIERIAKEGRKYGVSLCIVSQRPSEISETIFSQCNNFVVMRLSNPNDQAYVSRLLPENSSNLVGSLSTLASGQALLIGDSVVMPSIIKIHRCNPEPSSSDVKYLEEWKKTWISIEFNRLISFWESEN